MVTFVTSNKSKDMLSFNSGRPCVPHRHGVKNAPHSVGGLCDTRHQLEKRRKDNTLHVISVLRLLRSKNVCLRETRKLHTGHI